MMNFLYESKELDWSVLKGGSNGLMILPDQTSQSKGNQLWIFIGKTDAELELHYFGHLMWRADLLEKTLCWERLKAEGNDRGWDGWMASLTWWTWVWASSGSWWWTGKPGVLQSMELQRVGHISVTDWPFYRPCIKHGHMLQLHCMIFLCVFCVY